MADFYDALDFLMESQVENYGGEEQRHFHCDLNNPSHYVDGMLMGSAWGISAQEYATAIGETPRREELHRMDFEEAASIHHAFCWLPIKGQSIKSQMVANCLMDAYNHIGDYAISILQCLCKCYGHQINITGTVDTRTITALNGVTEDFEAAFHNRYNDARRQLLMYHYGKPLSPGWAKCFQSWHVPVLNPPLNHTLESQLKRISRAGSALVLKEKFMVLDPDKALIFGGVLWAVRLGVLVGISLVLYYM